MLNLFTGILFSVLLLPSNISKSCNYYVEFHPVRSNIMLQVVLKSYGYYEGKIDGIFGNVSTKALISLQKTNNIDADGKIGPQTCTLLLNKKTTVRKNITTKNISTNIPNSENPNTQEIYNSQLI